MGLAIINRLANYTLLRTAQNVIPVDESLRVYLTNVSNFEYEYAGNGIYRLRSLNIGNATLPYVYALAFTANLSGAEVDPISGVVTIGNDFTGGNLEVVINPIYDQHYYPLANGNTAYQATTTIRNPLTPNSSSVTPYNNLTITGFSYSTNTISANGGTSVAPNLTYSYTKVVNGLSTTVSNTGGTKEYTMHSISDTGATVNANTGVVIVPSNSTQVTKSYVILAKVTVDGNYQTEVAKITQAASATPTGVTYTYAFSNVSLSYSGTPVAATGNSAGLTPTLTYTLTKTGSDNSTETISASSIAYSVQGTLPSGVTLNTGTGKVTFAENATDNPVSVTIKATLTAPDGTEVTPTATLTQNARTTKAYISGFPTDTGPREADGPYPSPTLGTHNWPLWVEVTYTDENHTTVVENMTYNDYLTFDQREEYNAPVVTIERTSIASVGENGTLTYNFSGDNYAYDSPSTKISSVIITHENDSTKDVSTSNITINADRFDTTYFNDFVSTSLESVSGVVKSTGLHVGEDSNSTTIEIEVDGTNHNGIMYELPNAQLYYIHAPGTGGSYAMAIISLPSSQSVTVGNYTVNNSNIKYVPVDSSTRNIYVHHTPTSGYTTYIVLGLTFHGNLEYLNKSTYE